MGSELSTARPETPKATAFLRERCDGVPRHSLPSIAALRSRAGKGSRNQKPHLAGLQHHRVIGVSVTTRARGRRSRATQTPGRSRPSPRSPNTHSTHEWRQPKHTKMASKSVALTRWELCGLTPPPPCSLHFPRRRPRSITPYRFLLESPRLGWPGPGCCRARRRRRRLVAARADRRPGSSS